MSSPGEATNQPAPVGDRLVEPSEELTAAASKARAQATAAAAVAAAAVKAAAAAKAEADALERAMTGGGGGSSGAAGPSEVSEAAEVPGGDEFQIEPEGVPEASEAAGGSSSSAQVATYDDEFQIWERDAPFDTANGVAIENVQLKVAGLPSIWLPTWGDYVPRPPAEWTWLRQHDRIEVEVPFGDDDVQRIECEVLQVLVDGQFEARIVLPDEVDEWTDLFNWLDEDVDWRRIVVLDAVEY